MRESLSINRRDFLNDKEYRQTINTVRAWSRKDNITKIQSYNRKVLYEAIKVMSNSLLRIGEPCQIKWSDLEIAHNLDKKDQKISHLIRVRKEISKKGEPRTVISPTVACFDVLRELQGIKKRHALCGHTFHQSIVISWF